MWNGSGGEDEEDEVCDYIEKPIDYIFLTEKIKDIKSFYNVKSRQEDLEQTKMILKNRSEVAAGGWLSMKCASAKYQCARRRRLKRRVVLPLRVTSQLHVAGAGSAQVGIAAERVD